MSTRWTWVTKDRRVLYLDEMTEEHIKSCLAMLRRQGFCSLARFKQALAAVGSLQGDMAQCTATQEFDSMHPNRAIDLFEKELARRAT